MHELILLYFLIINILASGMAGYDKWTAPRKGRRISEKTFFILALAGGSIGLYLSLIIFHHKTRHWYFMYGIPAIIAAQAVLAWYLFRLYF